MSFTSAKIKNMIVCKLKATKAYKAYVLISIQIHLILSLSNLILSFSCIKIGIMPKVKCKILQKKFEWLYISIYSK